MIADVPLLDLQRAIVSGFVFKVIVLVCAAFMAITFCQSGIDKLSDYSGNRSYFQSQFAKSIFRNLAGVLLPVLLFLELASGVLCVFGIGWMIFRHELVFVFLGLSVSAGTLLCLLLGQRVAKDYAGASTITGYFIVAVLGLIATAAVL